VRRHDPGTSARRRLPIFLALILLSTERFDFTLVVGTDERDLQGRGRLGRSSAFSHQKPVGRDWIGLDNRDLRRGDDVVDLQ